jgi:hypothetical protein
VLISAFLKTVGEMCEFPHFCKSEGGHVSISTLLQMLEDMC